MEPENLIDKSRDDLLKIGVITSTHGLRGQVKVFPTTEDVKRFDQLVGENVLIDAAAGLRAFTVDKVQYFKSMVILKFQEIDTIKEIQQYRGNEIYVTREQAIPLEAGEYFIGDLIGMRVVLEDGTLFGVVKDVLQTGANDVYVVETSEHGEVLLPAIRDCIQKIEPEKSTMTVHLMEGLI